ncbi:EF-hand domain-containing protein [archaeon]|nr:MAG: EF-hand domain-containing protein [archaeon]
MQGSSWAASALRRAKSMKCHWPLPQHPQQPRLPQRPHHSGAVAVLALLHAALPRGLKCCCAATGAYLVDHKAECWHPGFSTGSRGGNYLAALAADVIRTLRAQKQAAQRFERAHQALTGGSTPRATSARSGSLVRTLLALPQPSSSPGRNVHTPLATATTSVLLPSSASRSRGSSRNSSRGFSLASTSRLLPSHEETMQPGHAMAQLLRHKERNHSSFAKREEERQRNDAAAASGSDTLLQQLMNTLAETPSTSRPATRGLHAVLKGRTLPQTPRAESFDEPSLSDSLVSIPSFALRVAAGDTARRNGGGADPAAACPRTPVRLERLTHAASARSEQIDSFVEACHDYFTHEEGAEEESVLASPSPFVSVGTHTPRMDDDERLPPVRVPPATTQSRAESVASQAPMSDDGVVVAGAGASATTSGCNKKPRLLSFLQKTQERAGQAPPTPAIMAALSDDTVSGAPVTTAETRMYQLAKYEELSRSLSKVSVQAILRERNPQLMAMLAYYKDRKRVGGNYRSMDKEELQRRAAGERSAGFDAETQDDERREERLVRTMALGVIAELARTAQERGSAVLGKEVPPHSRSSSAASSAPGTASDRRGAQRAADAGGCFAPPHADAQGGTLLAAAETGKQPMLESGHTTDVIKSQLDREATAMKAASIWTRKTLSRSRSRVPAALTAEKADGILAGDEVHSRATEPDAIALQFRAAAEEAARVQAQRVQAVAALRAAARGEKPAALVRKEEEEARARAACAPHMPLSEVQLRSHAKRLQPLVPSPAVAASTTAQRSAAARRSPGKTGAAPAGSPPIKQGALRRHVARGSGVLAASMEAARVPVLTPEEYLTLCKRAKIGNELKRDVQAFADLYKLVDPECTGTITFDKFMSAMDKGNVSLAYMKRQMEVLFRSADKEGTGTLAVADFARVIFPRAEHHNLNEILAYTTYAGPSAERIRAEYIKRNPEALELLRDLFNAYDADGSGSIDRSELKNAFAAVRGMYTKKSSEYMSADKLSEDTIDIMANVDASGDGEISFEEFVVLVGPHLVDGE